MNEEEDIIDFALNVKKFAFPQSTQPSLDFQNSQSTNESLTQPIDLTSQPMIDSLSTQPMNQDQMIPKTNQPTLDSLATQPMIDISTLQPLNQDQIVPQSEGLITQPIDLTTQPVNQDEMVLPNIETNDKESPSESETQEMDESERNDMELVNDGTRLSNNNKVDIPKELSASSEMPMEKPKEKTLPVWMFDPKEVQMKESKELNERQHKKIETQIEATDEHSQEEKTQTRSAPKHSYKDVENLADIIKGRAICFDLETSGFGKEDGIIEIGAVELIDGFRTGALFQSYAFPRREIHSKATEVHGLSNSKLIEAPPIQLVLTSFMDWVGKSPLIAHNVRFDMRLLTQDLERLNMKHLIDEKLVFCTMRHWRKIYPGKNYGLNDIATHFDLSLEYRIQHTALQDAELLAKVVKAIALKIPTSLSETKNSESTEASKGNLTDQITKQYTTND